MTFKCLFAIGIKHVGLNQNAKRFVHKHATTVNTFCTVPSCVIVLSILCKSLRRNFYVFFMRIG